MGAGEHQDRSRTEGLSALLSAGAPLALASLAQTLVGTFAVAAAGRLGERELAAVGLGASVHFTVAVFGVGVLLGLEPLFAYLAGRGEHALSRRVLARGLVLAALASFLLALVSGLVALLLPSFGLDEPTAALVRSYTWGRLPGLWPYLGFVVVRGAATARGRTRAVLGSAFVADVVVLVASPVLAARLGVFGIGLAESLGGWTGLLTLIASVRGIERSAGIELGRPLFAIGAPLGLAMLAEYAVFAAVGLAAARVEPEALGAHQIALTWVGTLFMLPVGFSGAVAAKVGAALARGERSVAREAGVRALGLALAFGLVALLVFVAIPRELAELITGDPHAVAVATPLLALAGLTLVADSAQAMLAGAVRGAGDTRFALWATLAGHWSLGFPLGLALATFGGLGVLGLWMGLALGLAAMAVALALRFLRLVGQSQRSMDPIVRMSAGELAGRIRNKELSPVEVVLAHVRRIEEVNPKLNAVVADRFERAVDEGRAAEAALVRTPKGELPPLFGVPCTIKDFYAVTGLPQTGGLWLRKAAIADADAVVVERVRRAGAIVLGVTNVPEGGLWLESDNRVYGRTNNPWDLRRTPGGSSGGEGAIVAAGGSPFGMGSDIGGSIRLPAAFCGVTGHKPTGRMVPNTGHWPPLEGALQGYLACGPLARRVDDLVTVWKIVAGADGRGITEELELGDPERVDLRGVSVFPLEEGGVPVEPALVSSLRRAAYVLERRGARIEQLRPDLLREAVWVWGAMMSAEEGPSYAELVSGDPELSVLREVAKLPFGRSRHTAPVLAVILGERVMKRFPNRQGARLIELGKSIAREIEDKLGDRGVILHPPYSRSAPRHGAPLLRPFDAGFTAIFNVLELPATQVPTGLDQRGLPVGVQVVGARGRDHLCLAVAKALEEELGVLTPIEPRARARAS